jgi:orotidine-5'-phosphate decarboxylase
MASNPPHSPTLERRLIFALDVASPAEALSWVKRLRGAVHHYKIGLELFLAGGWDVVHAVAEASGPVFLDVKLLDIPATVVKALQVIERHADDVWLSNVHVFNNMALEGRRAELGTRLKIIVVPVLTSMSEADLRSSGVQLSLPDYMALQSQRARDLGYDGVVASGHEAAALRRRFGPDFLIVCPGVRPAWAAVQSDDQSRVMNPGDAIRAGADYLVVGRPIREHADPKSAAARIQAEIAGALA